jgi:glyoxylase-like metal-dependent hydrolase (beta-lactamase superfamily II)
MTPSLPSLPSRQSLPFVQPLAHGIQLIDTGFHRADFDASYLIVEEGRAAFVDTGTNDSVPRLLAALQASALAPEAVDYVIATHVHLDHAGGVGVLMQHLPQARLVVHPHGAPHLIDPTRLVQGARAVYGAEEVERTYGTVVGVAASRVLSTHDAMVLTLAGRELRFFDTPGHARHHHCIWDPRSRGFFTGDTFGLSYREFDTAHGAWLMPTTTPVQFEPDALRRSVGRMLELAPERMYLTHYGPVGDVARLAPLLLGQLDEMVALARSLPHDATLEQALVEGFEAIHLRSLRAHGCTLAHARVRELLALDTRLNAQGMMVWLKRASR